MPKSAYICNASLALIYNGTPIPNIADNAASSPITQIPIALATASYTDTSTMATNEATYTNYVRQNTVRGTLGWTAPTTKSTNNVVPVEYPQCGLTGNSITSAASGVGPGAADILHYGDLNAPIAVSNQIQPRFPAGAITISEA
jgi:hypothetical protein